MTSDFEIISTSHASFSRPPPRHRRVLVDGFIAQANTHTHTRTCTVRRVFVRKIYIFLFIVKIDLSVNSPPTTTAIITYVYIVFYGSAAEYRVVYRPGVPFGLTRRIFSGEKCCEKYPTIHSLVRARDHRTRLKRILHPCRREIKRASLCIFDFLLRWRGGGVSLYNSDKKPEFID